MCLYQNEQLSFNLKNMPIYNEVPARGDMRENDRPFAPSEPFDVCEKHSLSASCLAANQSAASPCFNILYITGCWRSETILFNPKGCRYRKNGSYQADRT